MNQIPNRGFAAGEAAFFHQSLINPTGCVALLFYPFPLIFVQTGGNKLNHIRRHNSSFSTVCLAIPGNSVSLPILLNGIPGDTELLCRCPLARNALQLQTSDSFVHIHRSYHLFFSSYNGVDSIGHTARWLKYSQSFSGDVAQVHISIYNLSTYTENTRAGSSIITQKQDNM